MLFALCAGAAALAVVTLGGVVYEIIHGASPSISHFGIGFIGHTTWKPNNPFDYFSAGAMIYGTVVSSLFALLLAAPLGIAIAIYLSMIAKPTVRAIVGPLIEMLAAVPSIIMGLWGFLVLAPFVQKDIEPGLHSALGFIPVFGAPQTTGLSLLTAGLVLTLMILPIIAALSRDLFLTVPQELTDGAAALGATRWEVIRGTVLSTTVSGVSAAVVLGLGRALGEAIAVSFVIGDSDVRSTCVFKPGASLAERIANQFPGAVNPLHTSAMFYAALILVVISMLTSLAARLIAGRFDVQASLGRAMT
jgi:phosphate transport system permease protein